MDALRIVGMECAWPACSIHHATIIRSRGKGPQTYNLEDMADKPKSYVAHIQWNAKENYYAGFIPGIDGTETTAYSREELMAALQRKLSAQLKNGAKVTGSGATPKSGFHRVDFTV